MSFRVYYGLTAGPGAVRVPSTKTKFMQMLDSQTYSFLEKEARDRGASIQELLRTIIIPDWLEENKGRERIK